VSPFAASARPPVPVPGLAAILGNVWQVMGLASPGASDSIVGALEAAAGDAAQAELDGGAEAQHADRILPVMRAVSTELAAAMARASGVAESPYEAAARSEPSARAVARVVTSRTAIEAVAVAAATAQLLRTIARRPQPQVTSRRAAGIVAQAEQALELEAEQVAMIADMARAAKRPRDGAEPEQSSSSSSSSSSEAKAKAADTPAPAATDAAAAPGTDAPSSSATPLPAAPPAPTAEEAAAAAAARLDDDLTSVPAAVAARFLAKRARVAVDAALVPPANVASDNAASAFALWASAELVAMAGAPLERGRGGETAASAESSADDVVGGAPASEADVALVLLRRWHALGAAARSKWQSRALTLAAAGALHPPAASDLRPAEAAHADAAAAIGAMAPPSGLPSVLGGVVSRGAVAPFLAPDVRKPLDAATAADAAAAAVIAAQPRVDDLPHIPTRPFCHFVRAAKGRAAPSSRGFATSAEFMGDMRAAWGRPEEAERAGAAQQSFAKAVVAREEKLQRWRRGTEAGERQGLREAAAEALEAVGADAAPGLEPAGGAAAADGRGVPRPPLTAFMAFAVSVRRRMRGTEAGAAVRVTELSARDAEEMQALGQSWRALPSGGRAPFERIARHDEVRFASEQRAWEARTAVAAARTAVAEARGAVLA